MAGPTEDTIRMWIETGQEYRFYMCAAWIRTRRRVQKLDRYECAMCKARGRYSRGALVHHVKHLKDRPDLALEICDPDTGERQLVTLCKACHEEIHESLVRREPGEKLTTERWD